MKRCQGPCGRDLDEQQFPEYRPGHHRAVCRECFNGKRRDAYPTPAPITAPVSIEGHWPKLEAFDRGECTVPPPGWRCTREPGHEGPCAAVPVTPQKPAREPRVEIVEEVITQVEEHRLKKKVHDLEAQLRRAVADLSDAGEMGELIREVQALPPVPGIEPRERTSHLAEATPLVLASDWHIEEEVRPEQVAGRNRYNLEISKRRMERFFEAVRWGVQHQREVFKVRDLVMWLGGDIITNYLHPDNIETNLLSPVEAIAYAQASISSGLHFLLEDPELERIVLPCNDGNHGRLTEKMRSGSRIENSIEWLLYYQLQREFIHEPRVQFILPTSEFTFYEVYDRTIRFTHGDTVNYQGGVGGITVPLFRAVARWETVRKAALTCLGHFHQRICLPNLMVNGSLIGFNTYAMSKGFSFEAPSQCFRMLEPRRWCSTDIPLWVSDRADDSENK